MADQLDNGNGIPRNGENGTHSWAMWQRLVLSEIKRLDEDNKDLQEAKQDIMIKIAVLQTKAAMYGALAGAIFAGLIELIIYMTIGGR
jgi:hypothetical protein